jgi:hypothetical protein
MITGKPIKYPPAAFQVGDKVRFYLSDDADLQGQTYRVAEADHCFTWVDEIPHQISNWRLKKVGVQRRKV